MLGSRIIYLVILVFLCFQFCSFSDNKIQQPLNYFINLAIENRSDLRAYRETLKTVKFDKLNEPLKKKWNSIITKIEKEFKEFKYLLDKRNKLSIEFQQAFHNRNMLIEQYKKDGDNIALVNKAQSRFNDVKKHLTYAEKKLSDSRIRLFVTCGIPAYKLKKPSIAIMNQAQSDYVNAQQSYIKAKIGVSDNRAGLSGSIGVSKY